MKQHITGIKLTHGYNATLYDNQDKKYIDFTSGIFTTNIGHNNTYVYSAAKRFFEQEQLMHTYTYVYWLRDKYLETLCEFTGFESAYLFSSGTEATEAAWKVAAQYTGRVRAMGMEGGFHGKTLGARIMAGQVTDWRNQWLPDQTGMIIMEPYKPLTAQFQPIKQIERINKLLKDNELILCLDEIQSGFARTGKLFGYEHYNGLLEPNIVCIGKGLGNGFPVSAILGPAKMIDEPVMDLSSTHGGNPLACAIGLAVIQYYKDYDVLGMARNKGKYILQPGIESLDIETHGRGMVGAIVFNSKKQADDFVLKCAEQGLLVVQTERETVKIGPPLTIEDELLEQGIEILRKALK